MRLLPKTPKNEVLVASEPGKYIKNESQKVDVGENWTKLLGNSREDSLKSLLLRQKLTREYSYRYETLQAVWGREERVLVWVFSWLTQQRSQFGTSFDQHMLFETRFGGTSRARLQLKPRFSGSSVSSTSKKKKPPPTFFDNCFQFEKKSNANGTDLIHFTANRLLNTRFWICIHGDTRILVRWSS